MYRKTPVVLIIDLFAILFAIGIYVRTGEAKLGESSFLTTLSGAQLLGVGVIAFLIFRVRNRSVERVYNLKNSRIIWGLIAAGFVFLMADEMFKIHENIDEIIHSVFKLEETGLTDRIDDLLILLYAIIGLAVIAAYRKEFMLLKSGRTFLIVGFVLLFIMIGLDVLTNRDDILLHFLESEVESALTWFSIAEEAAKVLSSGFFILAFQMGLRNARQSDLNRESP